MNVAAEQGVLSANPFHLGWFLGNSYGVHGWKQPWGGSDAEDWTRPDLHIDLARAAERACFDFLLMPGQQSAWHTVRSAEVWLYHSGGPLLLEFGPEQDTAATHLLGADIAAGESPQIVIPPGHWQRARPRDDQPCLVSCVVVPGFDFADFALGAPTD